MAEKSGVAARREEIRNQYWPDEDVWTGEKEVGWFPATISAIDDAIRWAEQLMAEIDRRWPAKR